MMNQFKQTTPKIKSLADSMNALNEINDCWDCKIYAWNGIPRQDAFVIFSHAGATSFFKDGQQISFDDAARTVYENRKHINKHGLWRMRP